jgi:exopolysaccharide biosynthesis polyprenyl glycosylphosphotransferase
MFATTVMVLDACTLIASFFLAFAIRDRYLGFGELNPLGNYLWVLVVLLPTWLVLARVNALTQVSSYRTPQRALLLTVRVQALGALVLLSALYLLRAVEVSRLLMQTFLAVSTATMMLERLAIRHVLLRRTKAAEFTGQRMLVIGPNTTAAHLCHQVIQSPHWGARVIGFITTPSTAHTGFEYSGVPILGGLHDVPHLLDSEVLDEVVMADPRLDADMVQALVDHCLARGITYSTLVRMPSAERARHHAESLGDGLYSMALESTPRNSFQLAVKRAVDVVGAAVGLVVCGTVFVLIAPLVWFKSPGPIIFKQTRVGRNGRHFTLYKFRTMHVSAEHQKQHLLAENQMAGPLFKIRNDPRITGLGRYLRRMYLDELPQFWNVLKGDMSMVGTRPPIPDEVSQYSPSQRRRLSVRPGITGLWQCAGNGRVASFDEVVRLDCDYIDRWSIWLDVKILMRTCLTVLRLSGQ